MTNPSDSQDLPQLTLTRILNAPPSVCFEAWTNAERMARWIAPDGFTVPECRSDARPGGEFYLVMRGPDGIDYPSTGHWGEMDKPNRLTWFSAIPGPDGSNLMEDTTTATFEAIEGNKTRLVVHTQVTMMKDLGEEFARGMEEGWGQSLNHLEAEVQRS